jgi:hypothetical protein
MPLRDFHAKALRLLKLVRAALIHLSLGVHQEERVRAKSQEGLVAQVELPTYERFDTAGGPSGA